MAWQLRTTGRDPDAMQAAQREALELTLRAARDIPHWSDIAPSLADVPVVDKDTLRRVPIEQRRAGPVPTGSRTLRTSGTTGQPFRVDYPPAAASFQGLLSLRTSARRGIPGWAKRAGFGLGGGSGASSMLTKARRVRRVRLDPDLPPRELASILERRRPSLLSGHPHLLVEVGREVRSGWRPRWVTTHGEALLPEQRADIGRLLACDPFDTFGTAEAGQVAWQCRARDLYHVNHEAVLVEVLDPDGAPCAPGTLGDLVLTTLWNPLMPFIRYRQGDAAAWSTRPCRCGSEVQALERIEGRVLDWIVGEGGHRIAPQRVWLSVRVGSEHLAAVQRYRVHQRADGAVTVELVAGDEAPLDLELVRRSYEDLLGPSVPVDVRLVDELAPDPSGKFRAITSEVDGAS